MMYDMDTLKPYKPSQLEIDLFKYMRSMELELLAALCAKKPQVQPKRKYGRRLKRGRKRRTKTNG